MHDEHPIGQPVRLRAVFLDAVQELADPTAITLTVTDPAGTATSYTLAAVELIHESTGIYYRDYVPAIGGVFTYRFVASGNDVDTDRTEYFLVGFSTDYDGPCDPWIGADDVFSLAPMSDIPAADRDYELAAEMAEAATRILYALSEWQYPGICRTVERPCRRSARWTLPSWWSWNTSWGDCGCGAASVRACSCSGSSELQLAMPVLGIAEVREDGVVVSSSTYRVDDYGILRRTDGNSWRSAQDLDADPATDPETFQVTYYYGKPPPPDGVLAAKRLAGELYQASNGGRCKLPSRIQTLARQGETITFLDPMEFLTDGHTGLYDVDLFLTAVRYGAANRETVVASPDYGPQLRRAGTA